MMRVLFSGVLGVTLLVAPWSALAGSISHAGNTTNPIQWKKNPTYHLNPNGSDDIWDGSDIDAVHESFQDWSTLSCSSVSVSHAGSTNASGTILTGGPTNNKNEITWVENSSWVYGQYVLGITSPVFSYNGSIAEADIALNGYLNTWTTENTFGGKLDVKSIVLHEVGHWFGVQHNLDEGLDMWNPPTMVPGWNGTTAARTLETDDKNAFCFLYTTGGMSCAGDNDCPWVVQGGGGQEYYIDKYGCQGGGCVLGATSGGGETGGETGNDGGGGQNSCVGKCGQFMGNQAPCQCDTDCQQYGDCCSD